MPRILQLKILIKGLFKLLVGMAVMLFFLFVIIATLEFLCYHQNVKNGKLRSMTGFSESPIARNHPAVGRFNVPNLKYVAGAQVRKGKLLWGNHISTDTYGRRVTPLPVGGDHHSRAAVFFGCSFGFGFGLNDDQTLLAAFARSQSELKPYNYSMPARGANEMLAWLESGALPLQVPETVDLGVYVFMYEHYFRAIGALNNLNRNGPYYELKDGKVVRNGTFESQQPLLTAIYSYLEQSQILRFFDIYRLPTTLSASHKNLFCKIVSRSRDLFVEQFPGSKFVILDYQVDDEGREYAHDLQQCAEQNNLAILTFDGTKNPKNKIPGEGHPTALANESAARKLNEFLAQDRLATYH